MQYAAQLSADVTLHKISQPNFLKTSNVQNAMQCNFIIKGRRYVEHTGLLHYNYIIILKNALTEIAAQKSKVDTSLDLENV